MRLGGFIKRRLRREQESCGGRKGSARIKWDLESAVDARLQRHRKARLAMLDIELAEIREEAMQEIATLMK